MKRVLVGFLILGALVLSPGIPRAHAEEKAQPAAMSEPAATYVGADTCAACHEDKATAFAKTVHGKKADARTPAAKEGCETCHGPGSNHVEAGGGKGVGGILDLKVTSKLPVEKRNAVCLTCHSKGMTVLWKGSTHQSRGLACANCHNPHGTNDKFLVKPTQMEVCSTCHKQIQSQLQRQSHHPIREGKLQCTDCHNPHGTVTDKLISANSVNEKCFECHTEKRGPFLWSHAPAVENCLTCHTPHGSTHDKLLVDKRPYLCQRCHSNSRHPGTLYAIKDSVTNGNVYTDVNNRDFNRSCSNCHSQIHGSNHPSGHTFLR